jgi:hypothetical protein
MSRTAQQMLSWKRLRNTGDRFARQLYSTELLFLARQIIAGQY